MATNIEKSYNNFISKVSDDYKENFTYNKNSFKSSQKPMSITCNKHNEIFQQRPDTHLRGAIKCSGCKKDNIIPIPIEEYKRSLPNEISKRFIYISSSFNNMKTPIEIKCIEHDITFYQKPDMHKKGKDGCKECCKIKRKQPNKIITKKPSLRYSNEEYINRCKEVHGHNTYDYSQTKYTKSKERIIVKCPKHGIWTPVAQCHLNGDGCKKCSVERISLSQIMTIEEFISKATEVWNGENTLFDYSNSICKGRHSSINIKCKIHNIEFTQEAGSHLQRHTGCKECKKTEVRKKMIKPIDTRVIDARKIHGDRYEYDLSSYINGKIPMRIKCPDHGWFLQKMFKHVCAKQGCPTCSWSIGSKLLFTLLQKLVQTKIIDKFETEYTGFDIRYINPMRCDFVTWINNKPLVIEFDHKQHFEKQEHFHKDIEFLTQKLRDIKKNYDLLDKGISILRIHWGDLEYLESILLSTYRRELNKVNASIYFSNPRAYKNIWFS